ncbi:MAG: PIG-L family deacetylase [Sphingobacteriales bacterium]|nr:MAG: PIG-L family deacetylase [Sphingobacteriales bacterium]
MSHKAIFLFLISILFLHPESNAQQLRPAPSAGIYKSLQKLQRMGTVMYIAAHPDDENTRLITYLVHYDHINTVYLSLTRGDGGQNIIGNEQGAALGLIRTNEMMMARKIDGGQQLFTRFIDFGFTKSPVETFNFWDKQQVVDDIKTAIQQYKPDILICRFPTTGEGGHGQHTASAIAALEAFKQLEQSKDKDTWKPKRILFNAFRFGTANTIKAGQFELPINQFDPILGEAYGEVAGRSRSEHKSQGAGTPQSYGISNENFELMAGAEMKNSIYDGIDTSWNRAGLKAYGQEIAKIISQFQFQAPQKSVPALISLRKKLKSAKTGNSFLLTTKLRELDQIILDCTGLQMEVLSKTPATIANTALPVEIKAISRYPGLQIKSINEVAGKTLVADLKPETDKIWEMQTETTVFNSFGLTQAYWLQDAGKDNKFAYPAPYQNEPLSYNPFVLKSTILIEGETFTTETPVSYKKLDPTRGDVIEAVRIMPDFDITPLAANTIIQQGTDFELAVTIFSRVNADNATLRIRNNSGDLIASQDNIQLVKNENKKVFITIKGASAKELQERSPLHYTLLANEKSYNKQLHTIQYPHIPTLQYFTDASANVIVQNWSTKVKNIGYITGAGDKVAESLSDLGLNVTILSNNDLSNVNNLKKYDAIVCGVRLANTRKDIEQYLPELWKYINQGGTVVMQYNTSMGLELNSFSPLPIKLSRSRVTDEQATVSILDPADKLLNSPNKIEPADFDHWVQERGIYYPESWDKDYKPLLSMQDPQEEALKGGIIYAPYGKGYFVYTSLVFFRQLPAGNRGAIRLFLNLINIGKS